MSAIPLSAEDRAILELESPAIAGHTCKVIVLRGRVDADAVAARIASRLDAAPELRRKLDGPPDAPVWRQVEGFDSAQHVRAADVAGELERAELPALVARLFTQRLDRARPLWRIDVAPLRGGGTALVWRVHHALADGMTVMRLARVTLFDDAKEPGARPAPGGGAPDDARRRGSLAAVLEREFSRSRTRSPFTGEIGRRREVEFASAPLAPLHDAAKALAGATVNDAVLACVAGALRRWLEHHHGELGDLRVKVPVSLHAPGDDAGNRDSFFTLALPLHEPEPAARLAAIRAQTEMRKEQHDAQELDQLQRELARLSPRLEHLVERLERSPRRFALNVSNVPGPRAVARALGCDVASVHALAEIAPQHALRVAVVSYAGTLCFGLCADPEIVHDLGMLAGALEAEAAALSVPQRE